MKMMQVIEHFKKLLLLILSIPQMLIMMVYFHVKNMLIIWTKCSWLKKADGEIVWNILTMKSWLHTIYKINWLQKLKEFPLMIFKTNGIHFSEKFMPKTMLLNEQIICEYSVCSSDYKWDRRFIYVISL